MQLDFQLLERPLDSTRSADQDMVRPGDTAFGENGASKLPEASFHPVTDDRVADLLRNGESDPKGRVVITARSDQENESWRGRTPAAVRGQEVRAAGKLDDRWRC